MGSAGAVGLSDQPERGLLRAIRRWDLTALAVNSIIGAGIFGLPSEVFRRIGSWSLFAFVVCALVVALIILCFAEVASRFTGTGGPYLYAREAFGSLVGFEVGWLLWIARVTAFAANCNLLVDYLGFFWPGAATGAGRVAAVALVVVALTLVNFTGVRNAARVSNVFTVAKLVPLLLFIVVGLFFIHPGNYSLAARPAFGNFSVSVLLLIYAFSGFEMAVIPGGEARDPREDIPRALLTAIAVVAVFYFLIQLVAIGTLPGLATSARPLAEAGARFLGPLGAAVISAGALVSILGNLNVILLVASRLPFAMAERHELPHFLSATHPRFRTPHLAVLLTAAVVLVLTLSGTFVYAATISVIARLLSYGATCAALPVLRHKPGVPAARFRAPAGVAVSVLALLLAAWLLSNSTGRQARDSAIAIAAGLLVYAWSSRGRTTPKPT
ncbi:MAG TPA: amino acid permease [Gemmatimonadales bacterium]|nr:amino acid permease [Gemmatimonadales bacterium]